MSYLKEFLSLAVLGVLVENFVLVKTGGKTPSTTHRADPMTNEILIDTCHFTTTNNIIEKRNNALEL